MKQINYHMHKARIGSKAKGHDMTPFRRHPRWPDVRICHCRKCGRVAYAGEKPFADMEHIGGFALTTECT